MGDLDNEATRIFQSSMASNSWRVYKFAFNRFNNFRVEYKLELIWPVPVDHLIKYISYLSLAGFSVSTITTYIIILYSKSNTTYRYINTNYKQYMIHYTQYIII